MTKVDDDDGVHAGTTREFVTVFIAGQMFGMAVNDIHDVFAPQSITPVPLSIKEVAGVLNLRGRIVTAIDTRARLGLQASNDGDRPRMAVGIEKGGESYGLVIDSVGPGAVVVRETPALLGEMDIQGVIRDLADDLAEYGETIALSERIGDVCVYLLVLHCLHYLISV